MILYAVCMYVFLCILHTHPTFLISTSSLPHCTGDPRPSSDRNEPVPYPYPHTDRELLHNEDILRQHLTQTNSAKNKLGLATISETNFDFYTYATTNTATTANNATNNTKNKYINTSNTTNDVTTVYDSSHTMFNFNSPLAHFTEINICNQDLSIHSNYYYNNLSEQLRNKTYIKYISLINVSMRDLHCILLCNVLPTCTGLLRLNLESNRLTNIGMSSILCICVFLVYV